MKTWNDNSETNHNEEERAHRLSALALDALTLFAMHTRASNQFSQANVDMVDKPDDKDLSAKVIAWERMSQSLYDMANKALADIVEADPKFTEIVDSRWSDALKMIDDMMPLITMMVEAELAEVNPAYKMIGKMKTKKKEQDND